LLPNSCGSISIWSTVTNCPGTGIVPFRVTSELKESLAALLEIASSRTITLQERQWSTQKLEQCAAPFWMEVAERAVCNDVPISPQRVIDALWQHTPSDVVIVA